MEFPETSQASLKEGGYFMISHQLALSAERALCMHVHMCESICRCGLNTYVTHFFFLSFFNKRRLSSPTRQSGHLQGGRRHTVTLSPGPQAVPLFHGRTVGVQHPPPVVGFRGAGGILADDNPPDEVIAALHVVTKH